MKNLFFISTLMLLSIVLTSFSYSSSILPQLPLPPMDLSGDWKLEIDTSLDGTAKGNLGCDGIHFSPSEGKYASGRASYKRPCPNSVTNQLTEGGIFKYQVFSAKRGSIVTMVLDNERTRYFASFSGHLSYSRDGDSTIEGVWTDVEGNKGDFKLTKAR